MLMIAKFLVLLALANGTPVLARRLCGSACAWPLDGGLKMPDGRPLFGPSKTLRGILLAIPVTTLGAVLMDLSWQVGALAGSFAMLGDLLSSFVKRRMGRESSSKATGIDQIPEALLPALACQPLLGFGLADILIVVTLFFIIEMLLSPVFYRLNIRQRPY